MNGTELGTRTLSRETREVGSFRKVILDGVGHVFVTQDKEARESLAIEAPQELLERIDSSVIGDALHLRLRNGWRTLSRSARDIRYFISMREIDRLAIDGAGTMEAGPLSSGELRITIDGAGKARISRFSGDRLEFRINGSGSAAVRECEAKLLRAEIDGSGRVDLEGSTLERLRLSIAGAGKAHARGSTRQLEIAIDGVGSVDFEDLIALDARISVSGVGKAAVHVRESLDVRIDGHGRVVYAGDPQVTSRITSSGRVVRMSDEGDA
jgi:hypothetical protein